MISLPISLIDLKLELVLSDTRTDVKGSIVAIRVSLWLETSQKNNIRDLHLFSLHYSPHDLTLVNGSVQVVYDLVY